jgi:hypothetical protein
MRTPKETLYDWASELSERLGRTIDQIRTKGLSTDDFSPSHSVDIDFAEGSHAHFAFAFAVVSPQREMVAVFTEHCGYMVFALAPEMRVVENTQREYVHRPESTRGV